MKRNTDPFFGIEFLILPFIATAASAKEARSRLRRYAAILLLGSSFVLVSTGYLGIILNPYAGFGVMFVGGVFTFINTKRRIGRFATKTLKSSCHFLKAENENQNLLYWEIFCYFDPVNLGKEKVRQKEVFLRMTYASDFHRRWNLRFCIALAIWMLAFVVVVVSNSIHSQYVANLMLFSMISWAVMTVFIDGLSCLKAIFEFGDDDKSLNYLIAIANAPRYPR